MEEEDFGPVPSQDQTVAEDFGPEISVKPINITQRSKNRDKQFFATLLDVSVDSVEPAIESGATQQLDSTALGIVEQNKNNVVTQKLESSQQSEQMIEAQKVLTDVATELQSIDTISRFVSPSTIAMISSSDPISRTYAVNKVKRLFIAQDVIQKRVTEAAPEGFWEWVTNGDFVDYVLSSPLNLIAANRNKEYADRFMSLLYSGASDEEFEAGLDSMLKEMSDFGMFTEANRFYLADFLSIIGTGSDSDRAKAQTFMASIDTALGALDVGLVAYKAGPSVIRGVQRAAPTVKTYSGIAGRTAVGVAAGIATDTARMVGFVRRNPDLVNRVLNEVVTIDDPTNAPAILGNHTTPSSATPTFMRGEYLAAESSQAIRLFEDTSNAFLEARQLLTQAGQALDETLLTDKMNVLVAQRRQAHIATGNPRYLDTDFEVDDLENLYIKDVLGTRRGDSFRGANGLRAAERLADEVGGEVRSLDAPDRYVVVKTTNVPQEIRNFSLEELSLWRETDVTDLGYGLFVEYLGSPLSQTNPRLNAILKQGEAAREEWTFRMQKDLTKLGKTLKTEEQKKVFSIYEELRDGRLAERHESLTRAGFEQEYFTKYSERPTDAQTALFLKHQEFLDVDVLLNSDILFKRQVADGVIVLNDEWRVIATKKQDLPNNAMVWNDDMQTTVRKDDIPDDTVVYRLYDPIEETFPNEVRFFTGRSSSTRRLYHSDVMQRNSGGPRYYERAEIGFFIKQDRMRRFADGSEVKVAPLTIMTTRTEKQARAAVESINRIIDDLARRIQVSTVATREEMNNILRAYSNNTELNRLIATNNDWFPDVYDVDTLIKFSDDFGIDLRKRVDMVGDGEKLIDPDVVGSAAGMTVGQAFRMNGFKSLSRRDKPLIGYGGGKLKTQPAKEAIQRKLSEGIATNTDRAYMTAAVNGLLRAGVTNNLIENLADLKNLTLRQKLEKVKIQTSTVDGKKLEMERKKILFRLNRGSVTQRAWDNATLTLSNFLYEKNLTKLADLAARRSADPLTALRGYVFDAKLGMFAFDQLYVQSSQVINIMSIAEGTAGLVGSALYGPVRFALVNGNDNVIRRTGELVAPVSGLTPDQFVEMVTMLRNSGRTRANVSFAEFGEDADSASMMFKGIREAGRGFFKEGELVARISGYNTAYVEFIKKFPNVAPTSQKGMQWITQRSDVLTQAMTGASRAPAEQLPFLQFMSYVFRVNEALFSGTFGKGRKVLNTNEKLKLATAHTVLFGLSAWGITGIVADRIQHKYGIEMNEDAYRFVRKGVLDGIVSLITPVDTSISSRLSSSDSMFMLTQDMAEKGMIEFFMGPSGELAVDLISVIVGTAKHTVSGVVDGDWKLLQKDIEKLLRITKSGNTAYNSYKAFKYNEYLTKSGALIDKNVSYSEAWALTLGLPVERIENAWKYNTQSKLDRTFISRDVNAIQSAYNSFAEAIRRGDGEEAESWGRVIGTMYSSLTPLERIEVDKQIRKKGTAITDELYLKALQKGSGFAEEYE